jgi:UDP-N-acetylglucosamine 1-carboxyvinyltransferase
MNDKLLKIPAFQKLAGEIEISGSKNAALPILAATLLTDDEIILRNVPDLTDINLMLELLSDIGSKNSFDAKNNTIKINAKNLCDIDPKKIDKSKAQKIRASSVLMGPLLARTKLCPVFDDGGGCNLGKRALDLHVKFLKTLNASEIFENDQFFLKSNGLFLEGNEKDIDFGGRISVGATQNLIMAAVLASGETIIRNAAIEPEIVNLCEFLNKMGAKISDFGTKEIKIKGVSKLSGCEFKIMSDRIETGSYIICALMNKAEILLKNANHLEDLGYFIEILKKTGAEIYFLSENNILIKKREKRPKAISIQTAPHPLFPTDLQQLYSVYMMISEGSSEIQENLFENRFSSSLEIAKKMNANVRISEKSPNIIKIVGIKNFSINHGLENPMRCFDLRGGMSLICTAFLSDLEPYSEFGDNIYLKDFQYINRGYENFLGKFEKIGGKILEIDL